MKNCPHCGAKVIKEEVNKFVASKFIVERDYAILIPGTVSEPEFDPVEVVLLDGITVGDLNDDDVLLFEKGDQWLFTRVPREQFDRKVNEFESQGWDIIGYHAVEYFPSFQDASHIVRRYV